MNRYGIICSITRLSLLTLLLVFAGCVTGGTRVVASHDPATDFSQYRFFAFADPLSVDRSGAQRSLGVQLIMATTRELQARGMQPVSSNPDLRIDFFLARQTGFSSNNSSTANSAFVHTHSSTGSWSGYGARSSTARHMAGQITNGTLIIDVWDTRRGTVVFEGLAEARITENMQDNLADAVSTAVADILANMP